MFSNLWQTNEFFVKLTSFRTPYAGPKTKVVEELKYFQVSKDVSQFKIHTGWTGKYVPPGSPQVAPMGATWGLPRTKVRHMFITNPESTNFRIWILSMGATWGLPAKLLIPSKFQGWGLPTKSLIHSMF